MAEESRFWLLGTGEWKEERELGEHLVIFGVWFYRVERDGTAAAVRFLLW